MINNGILDDTHILPLSLINLSESKHIILYKTKQKNKNHSTLSIAIVAEIHYKTREFEISVRFLEE